MRHLFVNQALFSVPVQCVAAGVAVVSVLKGKEGSDPFEEIRPVIEALYESGRVNEAFLRLWVDEIGQAAIPGEDKVAGAVTVALVAERWGVAVGGQLAADILGIVAEPLSALSPPWMWGKLSSGAGKGQKEADSKKSAVAFVAVLLRESLLSDGPEGPGRRALEAVLDKLLTAREWDRILELPMDEALLGYLVSSPDCVGAKVPPDFASSVLNRVCPDPADVSTRVRLLEIALVRGDREAVDRLAPQGCRDPYDPAALVESLGLDKEVIKERPLREHLTALVLSALALAPRPPQTPVERVCEVAALLAERGLPALPDFYLAARSAAGNDPRVLASLWELFRARPPEGAPSASLAVVQILSRATVEAGMRDHALATVSLLHGQLYVGQPGRPRMVAKSVLARVLPACLQAVSDPALDLARARELRSDLDTLTRVRGLGGDRVSLYHLSLLIRMGLSPRNIRASYRRGFLWVPGQAQNGFFRQVFATALMRYALQRRAPLRDLSNIVHDFRGCFSDDKDIIQLWKQRMEAELAKETTAALVQRIKQLGQAFTIASSSKKNIPDIAETVGMVLMNEWEYGSKAKALRSAGVRLEALEKREMARKR